MDYRQELIKQIKAADLPPPVHKARFKTWAFDLLFADHAVTVDYCNGVCDSGRQSDVTRENDKIVEAQLAGFIVIRCTAQTVANGTALRYIKRALKKAESSQNRVKIPAESQKVKDAKRTLKDLLGRLED